MSVELGTQSMTYYPVSITGFPVILRSIPDANSIGGSRAIHTQ
ncbi:MAG: hypothetical protein ACFB0D_17150 [Phormidesmis sp.]